MNIVDYTLLPKFIEGYNTLNVDIRAYGNGATDVGVPTHTYANRKRKRGENKSDDSRPTKRLPRDTHTILPIQSPEDNTPLSAGVAKRMQERIARGISRENAMLEVRNCILSFATATCHVKDQFNRAGDTIDQYEEVPHKPITDHFVRTIRQQVDACDIRQE